MNTTKRNYPVNRIQIDFKIKGYKSVARPSKFGNPFSVKEFGREEAIRKFKQYLIEKLQEDPEFLEELRGFDIGCFCKIDQDCHGDIILDMLYGNSSISNAIRKGGKK